MDPKLGEWVEERGTGMEDLLVMVGRGVEGGGGEQIRSVVFRWYFCDYFVFILCLLSIKEPLL